MIILWASLKKSMLITYKTANKIEYPAFLLPSDNWWQQDGLVFLDNGILDDRNVNNKSLGFRRLISSRKTELYPLTKCVNSLVELIKSNHHYFIDSRGMCFEYVKTLLCDIKTKKITKVVLRETYSIIWVSGVNFPFRVPNPPQKNFAVILYYKSLPWLLYGYSDTVLKKLKRKV